MGAKAEAKAGAPEWRSRDKTRSGRFILRSLWNHGFMKSTKLLHAFGGCVALVSSFILLSWTMVTGGKHRGPAVLNEVMAGGLFVACLGFLTKTMRKKLEKLGKCILIPAALSLLCLAFATGTNSA